MPSSYFIAAATTLFFAATSLADPLPVRIEAAVPAVVVRAPVATTSPIPLGCYKSLSGLVEPADSYVQFQTSGSCQTLCVPLSHPVLAINFQTCYCADSIDAASKVDDKFCDTPCPGYGTVSCGGNGTNGITYYSLWNAGYEGNNAIPGGGGAASASAGGAAASSTSSSSPSVVTIGGQTVVVTQSSTPGSGSGSGPNTVGIVAGVVVGLVLVSAIGIGVWLYIRNKRRREVEEEHKRQAAISAYTPASTLKPGSAGGQSLADTRLDQSIMSSRRMSDGSIADNRDYSRRILKVTNA